jgi:hypothetical protein
MVNQNKRDREVAFRTIGIIAALYSIVFVVAIAIGYFLLLGESFSGAVLGAIAAAIAFASARLIGSEEDGIKANLPLFVFLLIISAVGVFNTLMLTLEGRQIFTKAISSAERQIARLEATFEKDSTTKVKEQIKKFETVAALHRQLEQEIRNPSNCGQGPAAMLIVENLTRELQGFKKLSQRGGNPCANVEDLIASYQVTIPALLKSTDWYKPYSDWKDTHDKLTSKTNGFFPASVRKLREQQEVVNSALGLSLVREVKPQLEKIASEYREAYMAAGKYVDTSALKPDLDLLSVRSVGEWSQLINLVIDNSDKPTTYIYPTLAIFADWLMIYLFQQVRRRRVNSHSSARLDIPSGLLR